MKVIINSWNDETQEYVRQDMKDVGVNPFVFHAKALRKHRQINSVHVFNDEVVIFISNEESTP